MKRVVVTGMGAVSGCGIGASALWQACRDGKPAVRDFRLEALPRQQVTTASYFAPEDVETIWQGKNERFQDVVTAMALHASHEAVAQAGLEKDDFGSRCAVVVSSGFGGTDTLQTNFQIFAGNPLGRMDAFSIPKIMTNAAGSWVAIEFGATGPMYCISTACASSAQSVGLGASLIQSGQVDRCIVGGTESILTPAAFRAWEGLRVMTPGLCRPFSKGRNGMILGDGAGIMILESEDAARARGAEILCEVAGYATNCDAVDLLRPSTQRITECVSSALANANIDPSRIGYVNAHGTGTVANDQSEGDALRTVFGEQIKTLKFSSTKPIHGHALGAAGILELIVTAEALREGTAPPTINFLEEDASIGLDPVSGGAAAFDGDAAMCNSFAFGGINASIVLSRWAGQAS
ncbi:MAG: beta-ketoacyl-[acyl-carrier-protein] synthase family protein [Mesorhizobium sp.]